LSISVRALQILYYLQLSNLIVPDSDCAIGICTVGGGDAGAVRLKDEGVAFELVPFTQVLMVLEDKIGKIMLVLVLIDKNSPL
jgi:hypothetical protein